MAHAPSGRLTRRARLPQAARLTAGLLAGAAVAAAGPRQASPADDAALAQGKHAMYRMQYDIAEQTFQQMVQRHPDNPVGYGMLSVLRWNMLLAAAGNSVLDPYGMPTPYLTRTIHDPIDEERRRFHEANDRLLALCDRILAADPGNTEALYFKGVVYENRAAEALTISGDRWGAVGPGRQAKGLHEEVLARDPGFADARVSVAAYEFALATVPALAKVVLFVPRLFGFLRADKEEAFALMASVGRAGRYRNLDALVALALMEAAEGDPRRAVAILQDLGRRYPQNYVFDLTVAAIQARNARDPRAALATYGALLQSLPTKTPGLGAGDVHFRVGQTHARLGELNEARAAFERALTTPAAERETRPLSYFHLGLIHERQGADQQARNAFLQVVALAASMKSLEHQVATAREKLRAGAARPAA
jgi:tetratricopeptide (TPR) repeat protein